MSTPAALLTASDVALGALAGVADEHAPRAARSAADRLHELALALEDQGETGAALLFDELVALCRAAAAADAQRRAPLVAAVRGSFASLTASGAATRAAVESVTAVNRLRSLRSTAPLRLASLLAAAPPVAAALLPGRMTHRARQWRAWFQRGLTAWLRGEVEAAELMRTVLARVAGIAGESASHAQWQAAALFADALPATPAAASVEDRRRLVRLDSALRRLADEGGAVFDETDTECTEDLLSALVTLRPLALPPRGAARAALLRHLQADLGTVRSTLGQAVSGEPRTVPANARRVADTLGLLELAPQRRRLLAACERLRSQNDDDTVPARLSRLMFELETEARRATGEPPLAPPPSLSRELNALAEVLAAPPGMVVPTPSADNTARNAALLETLADIEERRDRVDSGVAVARQRLLDIEQTVDALDEGVAHLALDGSGRETIADLRTRLAALGAGCAHLHTALREVQGPLSDQARGHLRLRRTLDTSALYSLRAVLEQRAHDAATGGTVRLHFGDSEEPLHLPMDELGELLGALVENAAAGGTHLRPGADCELWLGQRRQGAWLNVWLHYRAANRAADDGDALPARLIEAAERAQRLGGRLHRNTDQGWRTDWLRLPHREALRSLLRVEIGAHRFAIPMADVRAVRRAAPPVEDGAVVVDIRPWLGGDARQPARAALEVDVDGEAITVLVDAVEELSAGTPLPLCEPLGRLCGLAAAALAGEAQVLAVLDIAELVLSTRSQDTGAARD